MSTGTKIICILSMLLIGGFIIVLSGQEVYTYFTNLKPTKISYSDYLKTKPAGKWLELTDCYVDYQYLVRVHSENRRGKVVKTKYFVAIFLDQECKGPIKAFFELQDEKIIERLKDSVPASSGFLWRKSVSDLAGSTTIHGLVIYGLKGDDRAHLTGKVRGVVVDPNFSLIKQNETPSIIAPIIGFIFGLVFIMGAGVLIFVKTQPAS